MRQIFSKTASYTDVRKRDFSLRADLLVEKALDFEILDRMKYVVEGQEKTYARRDLRQFNHQWNRARNDFILVRSTFTNAEFSKVLGDEKYAPSDRKILLELETRNMAREREIDQEMSRHR